MQLGFFPFNNSILRFIGFELEGTIAQFESKSKQWRIDTKMKNIFTGGNVFFASRFKFPVNLIARLGGGIAYTNQEYERYDETNITSSDVVTLKSQDPYYKAGLSLEYRIDDFLYLEAGADYYLTKGSFKDEALVNAVLDLIGGPNN